ncbi:MAG TPA: VWA domain-containing protein [Bryobacteraceae bacterium]
MGFAQRIASDTVSAIPRLGPDALPLTSGAPHPHLRIDSNLVLIPVHVTTAAGTSVTNLAPEHFHLFEDNAEQKITHFAKDDAPISIGLLFDSSGSMHNKIRKSSEAAATFFKTTNADDEFFLVEFSEHPKLTVSFTRDSDEIYRRIAHIRPFGRTSLLDAIRLALVQMKGAHNLRKALVILSDGGDNRSRYTTSEVKNAMRESDVQIYAMGIFDPEEIRRKTSEEEKGPKLLDDLAEQTGGRLYVVDNLDDLTTIGARIGNELRNQYLLGYSPSNASRDGKYRRVRVNLSAPPDMPNLRSYYRHGYTAPAE